ncbi:MAG: hypothetical protein UV73_C0012G0096 [Candidatus Gottesmanbacteria bacterium GW2011_GWA2_43_14]|uniref:Uncharacterized protein n=1 Tax=Candidatus Gottesmanbacteria bacterium GW2011_GWA2_43_14 TaxID=1618443 RepID=A0A0G1GAT1_9BACT|nr:MAG: hypothetical protein UV73_C0012G0096 [Candidatus Gottesmanbacteria bacterium GW2011_GWA2_43_14]
MALIATFVPGQGGTPQTLPPIDQSQFVVRGQQIRDIAQSFNPSSSGQSGPTGATGAGNLYTLPPGFQNRFDRISRYSGPVGPSGFTGPTGATGATAHPPNDRLPADNLNSRIHMPALIPQNAIENSRALDFAQWNFATPPGNRGSSGK